MAEIAVPALISGAAAIGSSAIQANAQKQAIKQVQDMAPPTLSYDEALQQSGDALNPLYDKQLQQNLEQVDLGNLSRGFYGQLPGDALKRSTAADIETTRSGQIASLAQQMQGQSQQQALQQQQLAAQYALSRGQQASGLLNNALNMGVNLWQFGKQSDYQDRALDQQWNLGYKDRTGLWPGQANPLGLIGGSGLDYNQSAELLAGTNFGQEGSLLPTFPKTVLSGMKKIDRPLSPYRDASANPFRS